MKKWECKKCGHESDRKTSSSYDCSHDWWDKHELAWARERERERELRKQKKQQEDAEMQRTLFLLNDELWNTKEGLKLLKGENGWDWIWLVKNDGEDLKFIKGGINWERFKLYLSNWRDSSFGTDWFLSEYGQQYLEQIQNYIIQTYSNLKKFELGSYDISIYFGLDWSQTEQGKQYIDNLRKILEQRELSAFNDLCYTEEGLKSLKSEKYLEWAWLWLVDKDGKELHLSELDESHKTAIHWRDSALGTNWFSSKYGQQYLDEMQSIIVRASSNMDSFELKEAEAYTYFGKDWLQTEQGKQYIDNLREVLKKAETKETIEGVVWAVILFLILPFSYFSFMFYLLSKNKDLWWFAMFCIAAIAWLVSIAKKKFWLTILLPILLFLSALFTFKVILPRL